MALFHKHDWEVVETYEIPVYSYTPWGMNETGMKYVSVERCRKCGKIRKQKVKV